VPPLGLLYVGASLLRHGARVEAIDADAEGLSDAALLARVAATRPDCIGLTGMTPMRGAIAHAAQLLHGQAPHLVLGGVHATRYREEALREMPAVDALVIGEGEDVACDLLDWLSHGAHGDPPPGVLTRGRPFLEAAPPPIENLPRPARQLLPVHRYRYLFQTKPGFVTMISSRGCPFRCTFCDKTISGDAWRGRGAHDVVDELVENRARHGAGYACFFDDNFTLRRRRVVAICEEILRRDLRLDWKCESRADGITPEVARLLARAGCRTVAFGVESGVAESLEFLKKDQDPARVAASIAACRAAGIETVGYVLLGIPGEGPERVVDTLRYCVDSGLDFIQFSTLSPFPGTELHALAQARGWLVQSTVRNPADRDELRATLLAPGWSEPALARALSDLYAGFYLRPGWLVRQGARALQGGGFVTRARLGLELLHWWMSLRPGALH
jgi:radical SAM superfamily enzyme YgiQ (UPF0313 family)